MKNNGRGYFGLNQLNFPSKMMPCRRHLNLTFLYLQPSFESNLWPSTNGIVLFCWTLQLGPQSKVSLLNYSLVKMKGSHVNSHAL
jgi:hypothetical protein